MSFWRKEYREYQVVVDVIAGEYWYTLWVREWYYGFPGWWKAVEPKMQKSYADAYALTGYPHVPPTQS